MELADGCVVATLEVFHNAVAIVQWSSRFCGQGNTSIALSELTALFPDKNIYSSGSGNEENNSFAYWQHQLKAGRIYLHVDDDGQEHTIV